uniref:Uncharacterized protein n=1 Tax=Ananas comosus var. bracteatus TaxID=296719 RepID=A0A6V7Q8U4_ANACO|nr:unnamed protein product [Ananas comosus var. bracteatus]
MVESSRTKRREGETTGHARPVLHRRSRSHGVIHFRLYVAGAAPSGAILGPSRATAPERTAQAQRAFILRGPFVAEALETLYSEFRAVDNMVAHNSARVLKAFKNARVGPHREPKKRKEEKTLIFLPLHIFPSCIR